MMILSGYRPLMSSMKAFMDGPFRRSAGGSSGVPAGSIVSLGMAGLMSRSSRDQPLVKCS